LKRWAKLCQQHGRATGSLVAKCRIGTSAVESQLNDIAGGIEYWVNYHRRQKAACAEQLRKKDWHAKVLARQVGPPYEEFVGDIEKWADRTPTL